MSDLKLLSTVALLEDMPQSGLVRGQMGTVVESLAPGVYEVEFSDQTWPCLCFGGSEVEPVAGIAPRAEPSGRVVHQRSNNSVRKI